MAAEAQPIWVSAQLWRRLAPRLAQRVQFVVRQRGAAVGTVGGLVEDGPSCSPCGSIPLGGPGREGPAGAGSGQSTLVGIIARDERL